MLSFSAGNAFGHFIWIAKSDDGKINIYFGEGPKPDQASFLSGITDLRVWAIEEDGLSKPIKFLKKVEGDDGWFECATLKSTKQIFAHCEYGVFARGDKTMLIDYSAKYAVCTPSQKLNPIKNAPLDIVLDSTGNDTVFRVFFKQQPAGSCEVTIINEKGDSNVMESDKDGKVKMDAMLTGRWQVRAKKVVAESGTYNEKRFDEKRFYCTLVVESNLSKSTTVNSESTKKSAPLVKRSTPFPPMPLGVTSFGGAVAGDHLYFTGGHCGDAHDYYRSGQNSVLYRMPLNANPEWEKIHDGTGLQGLSLVQHGGEIYRVGGFVARNKKGEPDDLHSVDQFASFDFKNKKWIPLKPMPQPRSSLDAVVVDDKLFVIGGWNMAGEKKIIWLDSACWIDLTEKDSEWQTIETPFRRRALSVGYQGDKIFVVGGMREKGGPTKQVGVYDIKTGEWTEGPALPGEGDLEGFGSSCFNIGGRLIVSTYGGNVLRLNEAGDDWENIYKLELGRFFHRLLPLDKDRFMLVGGANMNSGKIYDIEVFSLQ